MRHNQMMLGIDSDLYVVTDNARAAAARRHRAAVGIGQRDLLVRRSQHLLLVNRQLTHFLLQLRQLLLEPCYFRGQRFCRLLSVRRVKLAQIAGDALLQLGTPPLHLRLCEVLVPIVNGFELAPARRRQQTHLAAELDELRTYLA